MKSRILVSGGNTQVPLDDVRVITNIFSGKTSLMIASTCAKAGFKTTLVLADCRCSCKPYKHKNLKIVRAKKFRAFKKQLEKHVASKKYAVLIHAAAISDYALEKKHKGKLSSTKKKRKLWLHSTPKIIRKIKKWDSKIRLIMFKLEATKNKKKLLNIAIQSKKKNKAQLVVANSISNSKQRAFLLIKSQRQYKKLLGRKALSKKISRIFLRELK